MNAYLDSSAIVKVLAAEDESKTAERILGQVSNAVASTLVYPEVAAALASGRRRRKLTQRAFERAIARLMIGWREVQEVAVDGWIAQAAASVADRHALRAADAVHLATALAVNDPKLVMVTWDRRLHDAARDAGLAVAPAQA